jgi:uncharacterized protein (DUF1330 family)
MKTGYAIALAVLSGCIGAAAVQTLHAQTKLKAYSIGEVEPIAGGTAPAGYLDKVRKAISDAHGRPLRTVRGKVFPVEGAAPPARIALVEWDSADEAKAFYSSKAWTDLAPERDKFQKSIRRYIVEVEP